jgi:hypothetical protein
MKSIAEREDNTDGGCLAMWPRRGGECGMCRQTDGPTRDGWSGTENPSREFELACTWFAHLHSSVWVANGDQW